ncbi:MULTISPECIES: hypothetical protein [Shewanella]|uniref:Lipoprotein n=1 Tax=Shewanella fidelis TaxID=173509 RepID=A0AAW8NM85_9GAMM|nr:MULTISPECIES: hypothetical protein [Shewanella]MDR8523410.1 hypothetical protein [Shewanella fidelis]MDW4813356.1 hypothetical protein [Shewanella fidelis]MDW4817272.1 hypothetical protein [Shewanella fidelis]MDW4821371.1 hypothetical protein [Shewanella fidelis]MDW4824551.1 hypothetical protein [Shewanella fidelis]
MIKRILFGFIIFNLVACSPEGQVNNDTSTTSNPSMRSPELTSLGFLDALYNQKSVDKAKLYVNEPLQEILSHYYIAASVQRNVLNLSMTDVELEVDEVDIDFFRKSTNDVTVIVKIMGLRNGKHWVDDRTLRLNKYGGNWVIVEIVPEKRQVNG